jgi:hydroxypyruvate isomerase
MDEDWEPSPHLPPWQDMAWRMQDDSEKVLMMRAKWLRETTGARNLCIAGGVGLNCVANGKLVRDAGFENVICFSGNREGMADEQGLENCAKGLKRLLATAEKYKVTLVMELLNSKVNHKDYMCDRTPWGVELCKRIGSERFKLLYDIYHMQIMEGDVIRTIKDNHAYIAHYHTAGNPGRNEFEPQDIQELNYPAIMQAIVETGYQGHVGQEFIPTRDKVTSLAEAVRICDV